MKSRTNRARSFSSGSRVLLGACALAIGIALVLGWSFAPSSVSSVSAANQDSAGGATVEMLNYALNFKSASNLAVFGGNSVSDNGSEIRGIVGSTGEVIGVASNAMSLGDTAQNRRDLLDTFAVVDQLPCTQVGGDLSGQIFGPGVYCVGDATLAGRMTVDAGGDANARFVFRVAGTLRAEDASSIVREGGAVATNVYVFSRNASIGANATIGGNIIAREDVTVGADSTISGKVIGVNGDVVTNANIVAAGTGYIEICKNLAPNDRIAAGTIFTFTLTGPVNPANATVQVPAGGCSPPIQVASGNQTVTETQRADTAVIAISANPSSRLVSSSLSLRQAVIGVVDGDVNSETVVTFTNQTTRTGVIEICKFGVDSDVSGFFSFTAQGAPGQIISVPVGYCSGPITITILQSGTQPFTANVTELGQSNYVLQVITTFPATALNSINLNQGFDQNGNAISNPNGGYANVSVNIGTSPSTQTTVRFFNRSIPGRIKVCKITADPTNIPVGTAFSFTIAGTVGPLPGQFMAMQFDVLAGPAAQGGFCAFAPGTFVVGTPVFIGENGINGATNTTTLPLGFAATQAGLRISSITATTPFTTPPISGFGFPINTNPEFISPGGGYIGYGVITARNSVAEIAFTNFVYRPAILKLCKTSTSIAAGTPFTFTIAPADPTTTWPYPTATITVPVGACAFVRGPFPPDSLFPNVGLFNAGTSIIVTENAVAGVSVTGITSPTLTGTTPVGTLNVNLNARSGTMTLNQSLPNFNEISFANGPASVPPAGRAARFDFDGDHRSDAVIFRPSTGTWWYAPSSTGSGSGYRAVSFGTAGDVPVAADYDGDGVTDPAVFRPSNGTWYILGSTVGFRAMQFGLSTDTPIAADFDGDGKADIAVFRPSNGTWYIMGSTSGFSGIQFGTNGDIPVAADFDRDGRADVAVFRSSNGTWYLNESTNGFVGMQFGTNGDRPVPADYDGDGRADIAVFRPSSGTWFIMGSFTGFIGTQFGMAGDTPVPADYDGDGKTDIAVYRSSNTVWYILNSSQSGNAVGGFSSLQCGASGDVLMKY